jgi:hypothetical protein
LEILTLKISLFHHPHTAIRIRDDIEATIAEFGLKEKRLMAVSDSGANILAGLRLAKIPRIACVAHNIHLLIATDILKNLRFEAIAVLKIKLHFQKNSV